MRWAEISAVEPGDDQRVCLQCMNVKPRMAFCPRQGKIDACKEICRECEYFNQHERYHRLAVRRETWQERQQEREVRRQQEWERRVALRQVHEECWREREHWYLQQPGRYCQACHQTLPATAFGGTSSPTGFRLHTRCKLCHQALCEQRQLACCLCQQKVPRNDFLVHYDGYALCGGGAWISLCCQECEAAFRVLSASRQRKCIHACCQRAFPAGQVIYAEVDPETSEIRYIGRTGKPKRRHAQHLGDASPVAGQWGSARKAWYTRSNWMQDLADKGLTPSMKILQAIDISPLVVEWEQRYIWHGIQQGWNLLNVEAVDEELVAHVQASRLDFLDVPFATLMQQRFFPSHGLVAFLHRWHQPAAGVTTQVASNEGRRG